MRGEITLVLLVLLGRGVSTQTCINGTDNTQHLCGTKYSWMCLDNLVPWDQLEILVPEDITATEDLQEREESKE